MSDAPPANVLHLVPSPGSLEYPKPNQDLVSLLRDLLALAESGRLRAVVAGTLYANNESGNVFAFGPGDGNPLVLLGELELAKHRLLETSAQHCAISENP